MILYPNDLIFIHELTINELHVYQMNYNRKIVNIQRIASW